MGDCMLVGTFGKIWGNTHDSVGMYKIEMGSLIGLLC